MLYETLDDAFASDISLPAGSVTAQRKLKPSAAWYVLPSMIDELSTYSVLMPAGRTISALPGIAIRCMPSTLEMNWEHPTIPIEIPERTSPAATRYHTFDVTFMAEQANHGQLDVTS